MLHWRGWRNVLCNIEKKCQTWCTMKVYHEYCIVAEQVWWMESYGMKKHRLTCDSHSVVFGDFTHLMESVNATLEPHLNFPEQLISSMPLRIHSLDFFEENLLSWLLRTKQLVQLYHMNPKNNKKRQFFWLYESEAIFSFGHLLKSEVLSSLSASLKWKYQACSFYDWNRFLCAWLARSFHSGKGAKGGTRNIIFWKSNTS